MKKIRWSIIGAGGIADRRAIPALLSDPQNEIVADLITLNPWGYVDAGENCLTNKKGIFVAGDCRSKRIRQVATACADGAVAALAACDYVDSL